MFSMADLTTVCVKLRPDDLQLLEASERVERLSRSDVVRRAIRAYAVQLGVTDRDVVRPKKPRPPRRR